MDPLEVLPNHPSPLKSCRATNASSSTIRIVVGVAPVLSANRSIPARVDLGPRQYSSNPLGRHCDLRRSSLDSGDDADLDAKFLDRCKKRSRRAEARCTLSALSSVFHAPLF